MSTPDPTPSPSPGPTPSPSPAPTPSPSPTPNPAPGAPSTTSESGFGSGSSSSFDPEPTPSPKPGFAPTPPPSDDNQTYNLKKSALEDVLKKADEAVTNLGANDAESGGTAKSESLTTGLGGDGSVWKSTLAENMRQDVVGIIDSITSQTSNTRQDIYDEWYNEPTYVDKNDSRANWGN